MRFTTRAAALLALAIAIPVLPTVVSAQSPPNLTGTWVLQADKSDFGMMPAPTSRTDVIDHQEPNLTVKRTVVSSNGEVTSTLVYAVDGKPYKNMAGGSEVTSTLKWEGPVLVVVSILTTPQGDATITDRFTLSEDGKTLTQARSIAIQGQEVGQTMVLAKQ